VFRIRHDWAIECIKRAGASKEEGQRIKTLQKYEHVELTAFDVEALEKDSGGKMPGEDEQSESGTAEPAKPE
jgi:hypothetical protein